MKVLLVNKYFYLKGGSERYFFNLARLLRRKGHQVIFFSMRDERNESSPQDSYFVDRIDYDAPAGPREQGQRILKLLYSREAQRKMTGLLEREEPDIAHLHNIHHQLSPSIIHALRRRGVPMVMTLHDYKMVCPIYALFRRGRVCELCRGGRYYQCLLNRCARGSYAKSLVNTLEMYLHHRILHIYDLIDLFISPSGFLREKMKEMGFKNRIIRIPYPLEISGPDPGDPPPDSAFCYFGRLSEGKGLFTLLEAVRATGAGLKIIGEGPLEEELKAKVRKEKITGVRFLGYRSGEELTGEVKSSRAVIVPSEWYENSPYAILEAFAAGRAVLAARTGGIPELVREGETGFTFQAGVSADLGEKIRRLQREPGLAAGMGRNARKYIEENHDPEKHYRALLSAYRGVLGR